MTRELQDLKNNYTNPSHPIAYAGINTIYRYYNKKLPVREIAKALSGIESYTRSKESKQLRRNPTFVYRKRQQFQIDLVELHELKDFTDGFKYLFNAIDTFTRFAFSVPMRNKTAESTLAAFKTVLQKAVTYPESVYSDRGSEIKNKRFFAFCRQNNIKVMFADTSVHAAYVERFNRTLKTLLYKHFWQFENDSTNFSEVLERLLTTYNERYHRGIQMSPREGEKKSNAAKIRYVHEQKYAKVKRRKPKYSVGDDVRISVYKDKFSRGFQRRFTEEVYKIKRVSTKLPIPLYTLTDYGKTETIEGDFYEFELTPVIKEVFEIEQVLRTKKQKNRKYLLVKWRGYKKPEWIPESDLV